MKYIVFWVFLKYTSMPCPCQSEFEKKYGNGFSCAVAHGLITKVKDSSTYGNYIDANKKYLELIIEREKACGMVINGDPLPYPTYMMAHYEDIRIDSIKINP